MGIFREFSAVHGSDNSVPAQLAAIGDMILQGNDGIMINCSSGSQVGGVIEQAADAGIKVVSYDAYASSDRSHNIGFDFGSWGRNNAEFVEKHLGGAGKAQGNVLIVQPVARGDRRQADPRRVRRRCSSAIPGIKLVGEVEGQATRSVAQRNVAQVVPGLPKLDAVLGAGGNDSFGIVEGMLASGYTMETMPPICTGADGDYIQWWREARDKHGYTATGLNADPEIGAWATYYMAHDPARRRRGAEGLVRAVGPDQQREPRRLRRRHRRADPGADLQVRPDPGGVHPDREAAWLTGGSRPMAAGDRAGAGAGRTPAALAGGAVRAPPGGAGHRQVVRHHPRRAGGRLRGARRRDRRADGRQRRGQEHADEDRRRAPAGRRRRDRALRRAVWARTTRRRRRWRSGCGSCTRSSRSAPNLRVFENFAVELPDVLRGLRWKALAIDFARAALADVFPGNGIDPRAKVGALSLSQQQMVEIARSAGHPATRLLILDEPTSSLGSREAEQLRAYIKRRRGEGVSFVFISHRLHESLDVADRIVGDAQRPRRLDRRPPQHLARATWSSCSAAGRPMPRRATPAPRERARAGRCA